MYRSGLVDTLVTHANMKGFGLTPLFGDRRGFMPPQLKTKTNKCIKWEKIQKINERTLLLFGGLEWLSKWWVHAFNNRAVTIEVKVKLQNMHTVIIFDMNQDRKSKVINVF